jgi:hypothetical protein
MILFKAISGRKSNTVNCISTHDFVVAIFILRCKREEKPKVNVYFEVFINQPHPLFSFHLFAPLHLRHEEENFTFTGLNLSECQKREGNENGI